MIMSQVARKLFVTKEGVMDLSREIIIYFLIALAFQCLGVPANAAESKHLLRIAVIDTGMPIKSDAKFCKTGHKDFSGFGLTDTSSHGSHVIDLIDQHATDSVRQINSVRPVKNSVNYCIIVVKFWDERMTTEDGSPDSAKTIEAMRQSLAYVITLKVDIVNVSAGGQNFDQQEYKLIKALLDKRITVVASAGNDGVKQRELGDKYGGYYPAMYDKRIVVVGSRGLTNLPEPYSNTGDYVDVWEYGSAAIGLNKYGNAILMSGTSQACAIRTGKIVRLTSRLLK
jgi:subtilisin family serine protease